MTELTDEAVKALLAHYDLPTDCDCDGDDCVKCSHYPTFQERASKQLKDAAPDIARALLSTRAELARVKADAAAAQALVVERAGQKARLWAESYPQSSDGRNTLIMYAEWIEELAPDAGTAELAKLRGEIGRLRAIIRVNGLRAGATDAEIDALLYPKS